jgi:hypothetical protein
VLVAVRDADPLVAALYWRELERVAAVVTHDSDFLIYGVERVVSVHETLGLFDGVPPPPFPLAYQLYSGAPGTVGAALLARVRAQVASARPDLAFQFPGLTGANALIEHVPTAVLADVAAILGNDVSKVVRECGWPWQVLRHLFSKLALRKGWVGADGCARQKLFTDLGLHAVRCRWAEYCAARTDYAVPSVESQLLRAPHFAPQPLPPLEHPAAPAGGDEMDAVAADWRCARFLRALCRAYPPATSRERNGAEGTAGGAAGATAGGLWTPSALHEWLSCGLGNMSRLGTDACVHDALRPLRVRVLALASAHLVELPSGWLASELNTDASRCVPLFALPPARVSSAQGRPVVEGVCSEACFAPGDLI